jgi:hypothetical protein
MPVWCTQVVLCWVVLSCVELCCVMLNYVEKSVFVISNACLMHTC